MIILYALPISIWPMLGKEKKYFYTRLSNNNDRCVQFTNNNLYFLNKN